MKQQLELLCRIQTIDTNIFRSEELKRKYAAELQALEEELKRTEELYHAEQERQKQSEKELLRRERELAEARDLKKRTEEKIMAVKTNKEYQAGLHEIEMIKQQIKEKEDAIIDSMDACEAAKAALQKAADALAAAKAQCNEKKHRLQKELDAYLAEIEQQKKQREALVKEVAVDLLANYTRLLKVKNGRALALAENEQCTGCSMKIPPQIYNEVVLGESIKTCPNCNRILYVAYTSDNEAQRQSA
ncbi:MAG: C4-type zinc ribbon domain-containing protein [Desulfobacterota bacterium]|nr:C4-type zinc ribbon domain-containing protein [Thermodesulfobacteriota bacterium]